MSDSEQKKAIERNLAESCLDRLVPLGFPQMQSYNWVQVGIPAGEYYQRKHAAGQFGRFWPLHICQAPEQHNNTKH